MRIIDRDFDFYESMIEGHFRDARQCRHGGEPRHLELSDAAAVVRDALARYRALIDAPQEKD